MSERFSRHVEQVDQDALARYQQAATHVGNIAVNPIAQTGEAYVGNNRRRHRVSEGHTAVMVSGMVGPEGTGPFYQQVRELEAKQADTAAPTK